MLNSRLKEMKPHIFFTKHWPSVIQLICKMKNVYIKYKYVILAAINVTSRINKKKQKVTRKNEFVKTYTFLRKHRRN